MVADAVCEDTGTGVHDEDTATVVYGGKCGDVNCSGGEPDMGDVLLLWYFVGYPGQYELCSEWAGGYSCTYLTQIPIRWRGLLSIIVPP